MLHTNVVPEVAMFVPPRGVCDQLVKCYLRTFEGVLRVLHIPTFLKEYEQYWADTTIAKPSVLNKILLVCAIGLPFYSGEGHARLRASCTKWIQAAENWLSAPHEKSRLNLTGVQIHILVVIARQVCCVDGDLTWITGGALLRTAMHCGLHRDPSHFAKISPFIAEMRRRLWMTVVELTVQSSLDTGMPPMLTPEHYDTLLPSNLNDDDLNEGSISPPIPKPADEFTQTSVQIALCASLPLRLEITRRLNDLRSEIPYDDTLRLGAELSNFCRSKMQLLQGSLKSIADLHPFQLKALDTLVRRFILILHRPYFARANNEPKYYYSRKVCLDISMFVIAPASSLEDGQTDDWERLKASGVGFIKSTFLYSISTIYLELLSLIEEQQDTVPLVTARQPSTSSTSPQQPLANLTPQFNTLRDVLVNATNIARVRIQNGETNAKGSVFLHCALARVDALVLGEAPDKAVIEVARRSVSECAALMHQAYKDEWGDDTEIDVYKRYDVEYGGVDVPANEAPTNDAAGLNSAAGSHEDMDWETLLQDESMDFGFGFEGSPENWIFGGFENSGAPYV
jgi:hypothetical protein